MIPKHGPYAPNHQHHEPNQAPACDGTGRRKLFPVTRPCQRPWPLLPRVGALAVALGHLVALNPDGSPQVSIAGRPARTYLGPEARFPPVDSPPPGYSTRITADRIAGVGPWATRG